MSYSTSNGTATSGSGAYTSTWGTLTFNPGQVSQTVSVPVAAMKTAGLASQTFFLNLAYATNGIIARPTATATLVNVFSAAKAVAAAAAVNSAPSPGTASQTSGSGSTALITTNATTAATTAAPAASSASAPQGSTAAVGVVMKSSNSASSSDLGSALSLDLTALRPSAVAAVLRRGL